MRREAHRAGDDLHWAFGGDVSGSVEGPGSTLQGAVEA